MKTIRYTTPDGRTFKVEGGEDIVLAHLGAFTVNTDETPLTMPPMQFDPPRPAATGLALSASGGEEPLAPTPALSFRRN